MARRHGALALLAALSTGACWTSPPTQSGVGDQFRVRYSYPDPNYKAATTVDAQFIRAPFPGQPLLADGGTPSAVDARDAGVLPAPLVTAGSPVFAQAGLSASGDVAPSASAVAFFMDGVSTGYWLVPPGKTDLGVTPPQLTFSAVWDFGPGLSSGHHTIRVAAVDANGIGGETYLEDICSQGLYHGTCGSKIPPPAAVISLTWDTNADLDLQLITPDGTLVDAKHPKAVPDAGATAEDPEGVFDADSLANCVPDGLRTENVIWPHDKPHGQFGIYVNLFDSCKQPAARFKVTVYETNPNPDGTPGTPTEMWSQSGELLDFQANGSQTARGLFVNTINFN